MSPFLLPGKMWYIAFMAKKPTKPAKAKRGRPAEVFKLEGVTFEEAVKKSLTKKKPAGGWPK
jgi:hypothetical protein